MNVAEYMAKVYPSPPCWALVADVYVTELGQEVERYTTISHSIREVARAFRLALHKSVHGFSQLPDPADYAIVLMGRTRRLGLHHCGIYFDGKVLHAENSGTYYQDMPSLRADYPLMEFWGT